MTEDGTHTGLLAIGPGNSCYVVNVRSDINTPNGRVQAVVPTYKVVYFYGKVVCKAVESGYGWNPTGGNARYVSTENDIGELWVGSSSVRMYAVDAFGSSMLLRFMGTYLGESGAVFEMNGNSQTFGRIASDLEGDQSLIGHVLTSSNPATATLKNAEDSVAVCAINDNVSVVLDAVNAEAVQVFSNRVNTMSGAFVVSNGTLSVRGVAEFANVPRIEVAGGCFEAASQSAQSFASVKEIVVGKNARLKVANARPFASEGVVVRLDDGTGRIEVGAGVDLALDAVYVGPSPLEGGTYSGDPAKGKSVDQIVGLGTVTLPNTEPETKPAVWTGNGGDAKITSLANWSAGTTLGDLTNRGLYPTFAEKGLSAEFDQTAEFKGLVFDIPGGQPTNTFALTGTGPLALRNLGIAVEDPKTDEAYRYEIDVPVVLKASQTWNVSTDEDVTLSLKKPVSGAYPIVKTGEGALDLVSANPDFGGDFTLNGGKVRVFAGTDAFGPAALGTKLVHNQNGTGAVLELHGTVIDKDIEWDQSGECGISCLSGTNVLKRTVTMKGSTKAALSVAEGALLRIEGAVNLVSDSYLNFMKDGAGTLEIAGPFQFSTIWAQDGLVRIKSAACYRKDGISTSYILSGGDVELTGSYQINSGWTPVNFYANCKMELNGYNQNIGNVEAYSTSREGLITSVRPATVVSRLTSNPLGRMVDYGGQLSVVFTTGSASAVFTNVINRAVSTTGSLAASNGVVVVMTENASWLNPTNGAVRVADSARLVIPASKTFSKKMDFVLSGNGRLELADSVSQRCMDLYLDDASEPAEVGTWGATGSGARHIDDRHFSGKGVLDVRGSKPWGFAITVR